MNNLKIGVRLGIGFAIILALLIAVGTFSLNELRSVNQDLETIVDQENRAMALVNELALAVSEKERLVRSLIIYDNPQRQQRVISDWEARASEVASTIESLGQLLDTMGRASVLEGVRSSRNAVHDSMEELIRRFERGEPDSLLVDYLEDTVRPRGQAARDALDGAKSDIERAVRVAADRASAAYESSRNLVVGLTVAAVVVGVLLAFFISGSIVAPIREAVAAARAVADGDLKGDQRTSRKDEAGQLLNALADMRENLRQIVNNIRDGVDTINTAASEIAVGNTDLSQRTEEQASSLEETAASMEELTSTVKQNADNARQANSLAKAASDNADKGGDVVDDVVKRMADIREGSRKMSEIISVIDGIAFQTNILALNAAVEAARAGEQGRGFAVVATEVRSLAQRSASAAKDIKALIETSVENITTGSELADKAGDSMDEIVNSIKKVRDIIGEISAASDEQSAGIEQINQAVSQMDQVTQQNAALVEESAAAAESLQSQAEELEVSVSRFRTEGSAVARKPRSQAAARPAAPAAASKAAPVSKPAPARNTTEADDDWEEF